LDARLLGGAVYIIDPSKISNTSRPLS